MSIASSVPIEAGIAEVAMEVTQSEAQLLAQGRFDAYHLAKAKRFFAAQHYKDAAYHASASLSHGSLPEAEQLRKSALAAAR